MILNYDKKHWQSLGAYDTANEINQQPETWLSTLKLVKERREEIAEFIDPFINGKGDIILTGAGTSAFVGNTAEPTLFKQTKSNVRAIATTDLTTNPTLYVSRNRPTLLISFARSGNSPESVATIDHINELYPETKHIFITCNKEGALSKKGAEGGRNLSLVLDERTNDKSLAMTSSFSNMYLALILMLNINELSKYEKSIYQIVDLGKEVITSHIFKIEELIESYKFERAVFLGSDTMKGIAQESALKMLELTDGKVPTMFDTPLGFRHGPKSIIDEKTLIVFYLSDDDYVRKYEVDLINEISQATDGSKVLVINNDFIELPESVIQIAFGKDKIESEFLALPYIILGQSLGMFKSVSLGNRPDNPSPSGQINRVVKGVTIYPLN